MNWRKSVITKKAVRYGFDIIRPPYSMLTSKTRFSDFPPVLANSFPKSGTHLLVQIMQGIPGIYDWGAFLASTPSFSFRELSEKKMCRKINKITPNELVGGHLHFSDQTEQSLSNINAAHYFIYRDPRDVAISEAYYLTHMNKWHRMHKYYNALPDMEKRIDLSVKGISDPAFPYHYPDIKNRFEPYQQWICHRNVFSLRFEKLNSNENVRLIEEMFYFYKKKTKRDLNQKDCVALALNNINPKTSHTFRKGKTNAWKTEFTKKQKKLFKDIAGDLLIDLGYEKHYDW